jgi:hypothetical protein
MTRATNLKMTQSTRSRFNLEPEIDGAYNELGVGADDELTNDADDEIKVEP